jgi:hypothetical protein
MAFIKKGTRLPESNSQKAFNRQYSPKEYALYAGIYQCDICGCEIIHAGDCDLPSQDKSQDNHWHIWKLLVSINNPFMTVEVVGPME